MNTTTLRFGSLALIALVLAGCKFHATTTVNPDGSGELRTEVGFTAEERKNIEGQSGGGQDFCQPPAPEATTTEEQRGDETWCITTQKFDNPDELRQFYESQKGITINRLEIADGKFYYDVEVDTFSETSGFANFSEITWVVVMPDTPTDHDAAQVNGNMLTWNVAPKSGIVRLHAESAAPGSNVLLWAALGVACISGAVLGVFIALYLWRGRSRAR